MRTGLAAAGAVLLVAAALGWLLVFVNPLLGAALCLLSPALFLIGLILLVIGLAMDDSPRVAYVAPMAYPVYAPMAPPSNPCPVCRCPLRWITQYQRFHCGACGAYR